MAGLFELFSFKKRQLKAQETVFKIRANPEHLKKDVLNLTAIPRDYTQIKGLDEAAKYIRIQFENAELKVAEQNFTANKNNYKNVIATFGDLEKPRIIMGAHYDTVFKQPGADDNASGVAGILELARLLKERKPQVNYRIDLVAFCLEEPPFSFSSEMGSAVHAKALKEEGVNVKLMISVEMIGFFSKEPHSQKFPLPGMKYVYPTTGNFIAVVGDSSSLRLVSQIKKLMKKNPYIDIQSVNAPPSVPGVDLSDHRSFWEEGFPAVMITDTAFYRNPNYHTEKDTPETLDYRLMAEVVESLYYVIKEFK